MDFIDLKTQYRQLKPAIDAGIARVLEHGQYILGPEVSELEQKLAEYVGARHCVGVASGTVEGISLRTTRLRDIDGVVWHVPNGTILRVGNKSQQWARAVVDVAVAPSTDLESAAAVIGEAADRVWSSAEAAADVLDHPEVLGLEYLGPDAATIRVQGKTHPGAQWRVSRLLRVQVAEALAAAGIELPPANYVRPPSAR